MTACQVCQLELAPDAVSKGQAILAKGQPVCRPCADRLGIHPDGQAFPRPRTATETLVIPAPPPPALGGGGVAAAMAVLALGLAGWALWQLRDIRDSSADLGRRLAESRDPAPASAEAARKETAEQLKQLETQLAVAEQTLAALKDQLGVESSSREVLVAGLHEEARQAREEASAARSASEQAVRTMGREVADAVARALAEQVPPEVPVVVANPALVEQYWAACQEQVQLLSHQGRFAAASREYDRIPKKQRRPDHDALAAKARESLQMQAADRVDLAMKVVEKHLKDGDYAFAEQLLTQLTEECGFPSVLDRLQPRLDEVKRMRRSDADREEKASALARDRKVRDLLQAMGSADPEAQRRAVDSLQALGASALPGLIQALDSPDPQIRWGSLLALSKLRSPEAVLPVVKRLKDADRRVRITAADVLAEFGDPRAVPDLIGALADVDEAVSRQAKLSLERITHFAPPAPASGKPADYASAWQAWWESGKKTVSP